MYAVIQFGYTIWGEGDTIAEAVSDANRWLDTDEQVTFGSPSLIDQTDGKDYAANIGEMIITNDAETISDHREEHHTP
tara:strand:- start:125 stop:358 length:234 start_codon:yes stop_codon:yes gene_type:complete